MLQRRWAQASGMAPGRPVLTASMQPALRSSCKRPVASGSTGLSPGSSFTLGRSATWQEGGGQQAADTNTALCTNIHYPLPFLAQALIALPAPFQFLLPLQ